MKLLQLSQPLQWGRICALISTLMGTCGTAQATQFSTFQLYTGVSGDDLSVRADAYPGKIGFINHRNESVCVNFQIVDGQKQVLRYSKIRFHIPPKRSDLALTRPGQNAKSIEMTIQVGAPTPCGNFSWLGAALFIAPGSSGEVGNIRFDATNWNDKTRDILIEIKP